MLVLSRRPGEEIRIGKNIRVCVVRIGPNSVKLGIEAPVDTPIVRKELDERRGPHLEEWEAQ